MKNKLSKIDYIITLIFLGLEGILAIGVLAFVITGHYYRSLGCILWGLVLCLVYFIRPSSPLHKITAFPDPIDSNDAKNNLLKRMEEIRNEL